MDKIAVFWGPDKDFDNAIKDLSSSKRLIDVLDIIDEKIVSVKTDIKTKDNSDENKPVIIENLVIRTDDYSILTAGALSSIANTVLNSPRIEIGNLWLQNPPLAAYRSITGCFDTSIIEEHKHRYKSITESILRKLVENYDDAVVGQSKVMKHILPALYSQHRNARKRPVVLLFLGDSGIGKTETAKYISDVLGERLVRIQCSMQQTNIAYQYIFGGEHNQNSMARDLIRRTSNVILLDEFDKVHPQFYNAFYQMFDEGKYVDSSYEVDVSKCVFICTSNFQSRTEAEKQLGKPILSRFSEVVIFEPLSAESKMRIVDNALETYISQLSKADRKIMEEKNGTKSIRAEFENVIKRGGGYGNIRMLKNDIENAINYKMLEWKGIL